LFFLGLQPSFSHAFPKNTSSIQGRGFERPTPIQAQCIPLGLCGRDILGCAETGSGKTASFSVPMIQHCLVQEALRRGDGPLGLVLAPTRELAQQIEKEVKALSTLLGGRMRTAIVVGGNQMSDQRNDLRNGVEVVVATPGRLVDHLQQVGPRPVPIPISIPISIPMPRSIPIPIHQFNIQHLTTIDIILPIHHTTSTWTIFFSLFLTFFSFSLSLFFSPFFSCAGQHDSGSRLFRGSGRGRPHAGHGLRAADPRDFGAASTQAPDGALFRHDA